MASIKAHICIGGPLDGLWATSVDFQNAPHTWEYPDGVFAPGKGIEVQTGDAGMYNHLRDEYTQYNIGDKYGAPRNAPSMVWLHKDLLKPPKSPKER